MMLYRGIAVPANQNLEVVADIKENGILPNAGRWTMNFPDLKPYLKELKKHPNLTLEETRREDYTYPSWVCACADKLGAIYYATKHNFNNTDNSSILISFEVPKESVIIDGRDFLYTLFQGGNISLLETAISLFGDPIKPYIEKAWELEEQERRIALCDLAIQDEDIIRCHSKNTLVIGGRCKTKFQSAFMAKLPISAQQVVDVELIESEVAMPLPDVSIDIVRQ